MAESKTAKSTKTTAKRTSASNKKFTADERAAMRERARELKAAKNKEEWEQEVLAKIAELPTPDRTIAERIHRIVKTNAPELSPKTWYGMPAYAKGDKIVCFFQPAAKFNARYASFGFNDDAMLDEGAMWPVVFAVTKLTPTEEKKIAALVKKAVR